MKNNSLYKKEGISNIQKMSKISVDVIAKDIAIKLCLAFPMHNLNRKNLFNSISNINMYTASMNSDSSGAKYYSETNSIFFNNDLEFHEFPEVAMHECIHFLQTQNNLNQMGLYNFRFGLAFNEAAVQLMASEANMCNYSQEKFFGITLNTNSPKYYPLECAILNQLVYFIGNYALYDSTLNGNDNFQNTFINRFNKKIYNYISKNLDNLLKLENDLHHFINELSFCDKDKNKKILNGIIDSQKNDIMNLFFKMQNYIIKNCFCIEYSNIRDSNSLYKFKNDLYNFKNVIGYTEHYTFYNDFYRDMMKALESKKQQIDTYGKLNNTTVSLVVVDNQKNAFAFIRNFIRSLKKLVGIEVKEENF